MFYLAAKRFVHACDSVILKRPLQIKFWIRHWTFKVIVFSWPLSHVRDIALSLSLKILPFLVFSSAFERRVFCLSLGLKKSLLIVFLSFFLVIKSLALYIDLSIYFCLTPWWFIGKLGVELARLWPLLKLVHVNIPHIFNRAHKRYSIKWYPPIRKKKMHNKINERLSTL